MSNNCQRYSSTHDLDIVRPEHAVEMFRLLGGSGAGDNAGLPKSQLAILPGTTHVTVALQPEQLLDIPALPGWENPGSLRDDEQRQRLIGVWSIRQEFVWGSL